MPIVCSRALRVLDLAAGTGANARYLAEFLCRVEIRRIARSGCSSITIPGCWSGRRADSARAIRVETSIVDLASAFDPEGENICAGRGLVTASALLDLVSEGWLRKLAGKCRDAGAVVLFALTYNGDMRCLPEEAEDGEVRDLVNRHQRSDKGFGPALGPDAAESAARAFAAAGYEVQRERSDWVLEENDSNLQAQLIEGWAEAAAAIAPDRAGSIRELEGPAARARRRRPLADSSSVMRTWPAGCRARTGIKAITKSRNHEGHEDPLFKRISCSSCLRDEQLVKLDYARDGRVVAGAVRIAVGPQLAVEQHIAAHSKHTVSRPVAVAQRGRAAAGESRAGRRR